MTMHLLEKKGDAELRKNNFAFLGYEKESHAFGEQAGQIYY